MMKNILIALQFLTIIPVKDVGEVSEKEMGKATIFFPFVGCLEGISLVILATFFLKIFTAEMTNALLVLMLVLINGGLHLDGLADTFDAIASRGDRVRKLAIMKDGTVGPIGVVAIVMALLLKYVSLNAVFFHSISAIYYVTLILMPVASRWALVPAIYYCKSARQDGLGRVFIEYTGTKELLIATVVTIVLALLVCSSGSQYSFFTFYLLFVLPVLYIFNFALVWFFNKNFGGMTGDSFGAVNEFALLAFLLATVLWLQKFA